MRTVIAQIIGVALLVLGAQGGIRVLGNHDDGGLLAWVPGGFTLQLTCYALLALVGVGLAAWGSRRTGDPDNRQ